MSADSAKGPPETKSTTDLLSVSTVSLQSKNQTPGCLPVKEKSTVGIKRTVSLLDGISLIVGLIIGSGIFASAKTVARLTGSVGMYLMAWVITGIIAFLGALSYAELGTMIPVSGSEYTYLGTAFGPLASFLYSWVTILLLKPSSLSAITLACGNYIIEPFYPVLNECIPELMSKQQLAKLIAAFALGKCVIYSDRF